MSKTLLLVIFGIITEASDINIYPVPDFVSRSWHFVSVIRNSCWSQYALQILREYDLNLEQISTQCSVYPQR